MPSPLPEQSGMRGPALQLSEQGQGNARQSVCKRRGSMLLPQTFTRMAERSSMHVVRG
jgi:hypothetical protein